MKVEIPHFSTFEVSAQCAECRAPLVIDRIDRPPAGGIIVRAFPCPNGCETCQPEENPPAPASPTN